MLDKHSVLEILQTIQRCTAVDRSVPTLMCTLGVANCILKQVIVSVSELYFLSLAVVNILEIFVVKLQLIVLLLWFVMVSMD